MASPSGDLDATRDGGNEGMQHFDAEIEKLIRCGEVDLETAPSYSTNAGNLRLELADFLESSQSHGNEDRSRETTAIEIER